MLRREHTLRRWWSDGDVELLSVERKWGKWRSFWGFWERARPCGRWNENEVAVWIFIRQKPPLARPHALGVWLCNPHALGVWVAGNFCATWFAPYFPHGLGVWMCSPHALGVWFAEIIFLQFCQLSNHGCMNICCDIDICNDFWMELCSCKSHLRWIFKQHEIIFSKACWLALEFHVKLFTSLFTIITSPNQFLCSTNTLQTQY